MEAITELFKLDIPFLIISIFIILSSAIAIYEIVGKFSKIIGKPVKWVREKENDHKLLIATANGLQALNEKHDESVKQSIKHDEVIRKDLEKVTKMLLDKEIDDWRWEILDMASAISSGREYSKEQYEHVISIWEKYEKVLIENKLTNGQVDASISVIKDIYKEKLKTGF